MNNDKDELIKQMKQMSNAMVKITEIWHKDLDREDSDLNDALCSNYPFEKGFEDILDDILIWKDTVEELLNKSH